jgi:peptidyl-prolyl cis-trans isomerase C
MKKYTLASAITLALLTAGCDKGSNTAQTVPGSSAPEVVAVGDVVATVNGKPISKAAFEILSDEVNERRGENKVPDDKIIEELIKRELLSQEIAASGAMKDPKFAAKIENAQRMMLSQAAAEQFIETVQVTDEDLKKEYDERVGPMKTAEYKAKHILVETEQAAKDVIAKLAKGEKFDALAKKFSKDPGSKDKGGDLGWFSPQQMVAPFSEAVIAMKNGETTQTPVQSQFGWHVIQREESREQAPPPFDAVKDQLKNMVQTKKLQEHITALQTKAKVENKLPAKPADAPKPGAPAATAPAPAGAKPAAPAPAPKPPAPAAPAPAPAAPH